MISGGLGTPAEIQEIIKQAAKYVRQTMVEMIYFANLDAPRRGHYGSSSSSIEIELTEIVRFANPWNDFIAWKPHASPTVYAILYLLGELELQDLQTLRHRNSPCQAYFNQWLTPLIKVSTGCMGFPLPFCCGRAMGDKIEDRERRVLVNLGDAEFTMPMGVESMRFAKIHRLNNYGIIVDDNRQSMSGLTSHLMGDRPLEDYFRFFGWNVIVTEGHDIPKLWDAFGDFEREIQVTETPTAIVAKTNKWYGLPNRDKVGHHAHMTTLTEETYQQFREENGITDQHPFSPPPPAVSEFFKGFISIVKDKTKQSQQNLKQVNIPFALPSPKEPAKTTLQAVAQSFHRIIATQEGRRSILYVDPDLGKFPGLLPNFSGPDSVEGEMYSNKNPNGFVVRAGLADPFAVAIAAGLGADGQRYPIIPILDGFGLLVSESLKQGSLSNSHFMVLGIETSSWEGLTHQPGTSSNTALRNLPDKPVEKWGDTGEFGIYHYYPCHPKESAIIFEDCCNTHKLAYLKMTSYQPDAKWDIFFDVLPDDVYLKGGYILGPSYEKPDLVILTAGREVFFMSGGC